MDRRKLLGLISAASVGNLLTWRGIRAGGQADRTALRGLPSPKVEDVQVIATAPQGLRLAVVKILTDQDGLYGYGCATFTQRADLVVTAVERYLKPFLVGKNADRIDDLWQAMYNSSYWRNGPVLNNAISGVDQALWDIKGRQAGMPVYQLLGGKCREAVDTYTHASGAEIPELIDKVHQYMAEGFRHIRVQIGVPGMAGYGAGASSKSVPALHDGRVYEPAVYIRRALEMFEKVREAVGWEVELLHDVHERITPSQAIQFCKDVEQFRLFFLEDPLSPEDISYFRILRQQSSVPLAMGELFNSPHEWVPLISERLIDYMRMHISQMGGLTPARKVAALGEIFGVRTAWHGPGDVSPIGHAANIALDLACYNFGVQEYSRFRETTQEVFSGCPVMKDGYLYANEKPGWGIEVDENAAKKYPFGFGERGLKKDLNGGWGEVRKRDGTIIKQ